MEDILPPSQVLDNHIQPILYMYSISQHISDIVFFLFSMIGIASSLNSHIGRALVLMQLRA